VSEIIPVIVGFIYIKKFIDTPVFWFIIFLLYNSLNDIFSGAYNILYGGNNHLFFNIRSVLYFGVTYWLYWKMIHTQKFKNWIIFFSVVIFSLFLYDLFYGDFIMVYDLLLNQIASLFFMIIILFGLIEILNSTDFLNIKYNVLFYISLGSLLYLVVDLPIMIVIITGWLKNPTETELTFFLFLRKTSMILGSVMYLIFAYGFYKAREVIKVQSTN
tara:strand:+ start:82 stop:729 length:648 start_codon:yes stop_codon:yes gene_type:complete